jgi:hypothetical protein
MTDAPQPAEQTTTACDLCDVVKPTAYALRDHMLNVHPDQFEAWRDRATERMAPEQLAIQLMTTRHDLAGGEPEARRLLAELREPWRTEQPAPLTAAERQFLTFALDEAADEMTLRDGFTDEDRAALETFRRMAAEEQPRRTLTPDEHTRAWHAIEGTAGEPGADPGTVLAAVLRVLDIDAPPSALTEQPATTEAQR